MSLTDRRNFVNSERNFDSLSEVKRVYEPRLKMLMGTFLENWKNYMVEVKAMKKQSPEAADLYQKILIKKVELEAVIESESPMGVQREQIEAGFRALENLIQDCLHKISMQNKTIM